ncbi:UDP-3-O-acyl-N-acetylglucosamine deacetylase [Verrucomicrobium spinosum]|uniref:UDP-3-O-acyl-N-acetylglucosamine deacetylase n=1 Tax=Verrucomicrobium spinosum TaxID=2736 RepID=UPI0009ECA7C9|nr:UDP-3-O-acyl-N-acetylglucosamine deacetylase [Verrucomicrobium spinosum]
MARLTPAFHVRPPTHDRQSRLPGRTSLHTGEKVTLTLQPAPADFGIKFRRVDLEDRPFIPASVEKVQKVERATTIAEGGVNVHTVEHVISALVGMGVDNAIVEMDANEPPIADGSSLPFVELIKKAGLQAQDEPRRVFEVREPLHLESRDGSLLTIVPDKKFRISCTHVARKAAPPSFILPRSIPRPTKRRSPRRAPLCSMRILPPFWRRASSKAARWKAPWSSAVTPP